MNPVKTTTAPAPTQRDILAALQSFRAFYDGGQAYSMLGRATFAALCGKLTQRDMRHIVLTPRRAGKTAALALSTSTTTMQPQQAAPADDVWYGSAPVYTPPARRFGGNVRKSQPARR